MSYENWIKYAMRFDRCYENYSLVNLLRRKGLELRMQSTLSVIGDPHGMKVVDIGCGAGRLMIELAKKGAEVWGMDIAKDVLSVAGINAEKSGVASRAHFLKASICDERVSIPSADLWIGLGLIEYMPDPVTVLSRLRHIPKFIFSVPKKISWEIPFRVINRRLIKGIKFTTYNKKEITNMLLKAGYEKVNFISYYGSGYLVHNFEYQPVHNQCE